MYTNFDLRSAWRVDDLKADRSWEFQLNDTHRSNMVEAVSKAFDPDRSFFDYKREEFDFGPALDVISERSGRLITGEVWPGCMDCHGTA